MLTDLTESLKNKNALTAEQVQAAVQHLIREDVQPEFKADFLTALARKGETVEEISGFAWALREMSITPPLSARLRAGTIIDVCGTGGDGVNTFNISTAAAFVVAAGGVAVAKHGNRAITSKSGSADVLEALGVPIDLGPAEAAASLDACNFAFFFAPHYHPAFRHIAPARRLCAQRGQRTIFNFLGPLLNPARPTCQLVGVPDPKLCEPLARVLESLGIKRCMVVSGRAGERFLDELSILGDTTTAAILGGECKCSTERLGKSKCTQLADLAGTDREGNARIIQQILTGADRGPKRDAVTLNAGAALLVAGVTATLDEGIAEAEKLIDKGAAYEALRAVASAR